MTAGEYVSTETRMFAARSSLMTGISLLILRRVVHARGVGEGGFRAHVHEVRALGGQNPAALDRRLRRQADTFAIPGIRREIDNPHDGGL